MKKILTLALIIVGIGAGYTGASWYFGKQTETILSSHYDKMLETSPYIKLVERDYQRGLFASEETLILEFFGNVQSAAGDQGGDKKPPEQDKQLLLTVKSHIQHGPFPGFSTLAAATTTSDVLFPEAIKQDAAQVLGDKRPFSQTTTIFFDGAGHTSFSSPKFDVEFPSPQESNGKTLSITWEGFQGDMDFSPDMKQLTFRAKAPSLKVSDSDGFHATLTDLRLEGDQEKIFDDIATLFSGSQRASIAEISFVVPNSGDEPFIIKQLSYDLDLPRDGDYIDLVERMGIESLQIGKDNMGPIHFDYSFKHLHTRAVAEISQTFMGIYSDPDLLAAGGEAFARELMPQLMQHAETILDNAPEFHIDRLSFANAEGEANLQATLTLNGLRLQEILANPAIAIAKLEAIGEAHLEEKMVLELLRNPPGKSKMALANLSPEELEAQSQMMASQFQEQVAMLTEMGYITREGSLLKTHAEFKGGQLLVNGKPFMPIPAQDGSTIQ